MDIVTLTILKILKKSLSFCIIDRLGKMGHLFKIGQIYYYLDGSNGETFELSTKKVEIKHKNVAMGGGE